MIPSAVSTPACPVDLEKDCADRSQFVEDGMRTKALASALICVCFVAVAGGNTATKPPPLLTVTRGLDDPNVAPEARILLARHGYVLLRGLEDMTPEQMRDLVAVIAGEGHRMLRFDNGTNGANCISGVPEVRMLGRGHAQALLADIGHEWHQDGGGTAPFLTLLHCKEACDGADTLFADGAVLFRRLSPADQRRARGLTAVYSNLHTAGGPTALDASHGLRMSPCGTRRIRGAARRKEGWTLGRFRRPLVERACGDGEERLLAGAKGLEQFEGMDETESVAELSRLLRAALGPQTEARVDADLRTIGPTIFSEEAVYRHRWRAGDAVLFDNHRVLHSTVPLALYADSPRLMWQVICKTSGDYRQADRTTLISSFPAIFPREGNDNS